MLGDGALSRGGLAFRSDGALFLFNNDSELAQLDPADASSIRGVQTMTECMEGASFRPTDNVPYTAECDSDEIYTVDVSNGMVTFFGSEEDVEPASLAFCGEGGTVTTPTPTPTLPPTGPTPTPTATPFPTLPPPPPPLGNSVLEIPTLSASGIVFLVLLVVTAGVILRQRY